jgi:hypothetical protein
MTGRMTPSSSSDDLHLHGSNPSFEEFETLRDATADGRDGCLELCATLKRLIEADVLSVPTATIAKSSLFHTRTTVRIVSIPVLYPFNRF